jgi:MerR family redox-sensitive transcriptional activator SoxR
MADLLTIGETAQRSGLAQSALRYYERLGLIRSTRTSGNQRRYLRRELRRIAFIRIAAQVGVPLEEIKAALASLPDERTPTKADWERLSLVWRHRLDAQIALMQRMRDQLSDCIGCGCLSLRSCGLHNFADKLGQVGSGPVRLLDPDAVAPRA